ncbi:MAG: hypothetical protein KC636_39720, partial [Myxococcales bacterium]|nr:hypothetical protein [Myxococcales bacterium]
AVFRVWTEERDADLAERRLERIFALGPREEPDGPDYLSLVADTRAPPPGAGAPPHYELRLRSPAARSVGWSLELRANDNEAPAPTRALVVARGRVAVATATED